MSTDAPGSTEFFSHLEPRCLLSGPDNGSAWDDYNARITHSTILDTNADGRVERIGVDAAGEPGRRRSKLRVLIDQHGTLPPRIDRAVSATIAGELQQLIAGDFNGDGFGDLAAIGTMTNGTSGLWMFTGDANGQLTLRQRMKFTAGATVETGDFNGDGRTDLLARAVGGDRVTILHGSDTGKLGRVVNHQFRGVLDLSIADLDGNGSFELVVASRSSAGVTISSYATGSGRQLRTVGSVSVSLPAGQLLGLKMHAYRGATPGTSIITLSGATATGPLVPFPTPDSGGVFINFDEPSTRPPSPGTGAPPTGSAGWYPTVRPFSMVLSGTSDGRGGLTFVQVASDPELSGF